MIKSHVAIMRVWLAQKTPCLSEDNHLALHRRWQDIIVLPIMLLNRTPQTFLLVTFGVLSPLQEHKSPMPQRSSCHFVLGPRYRKIVAQSASLLQVHW